MTADAQPVQPQAKSKSPKTRKRQPAPGPQHFLLIDILCLQCKQFLF